MPKTKLRKLRDQSASKHSSPAQPSGGNRWDSSSVGGAPSAPKEGAKKGGLPSGGSYVGEGKLGTGGKLPTEQAPAPQVRPRPSAPPAHGAPEEMGVTQEEADDWRVNPPGEWEEDRPLDYLTGSPGDWLWDRELTHMTPEQRAEMEAEVARTDQPVPESESERRRRIAKEAIRKGGQRLLF